jgi:hypothetical protein
METKWVSLVTSLYCGSQNPFQAHGLYTYRHNLNSHITITVFWMRCRAICKIAVNIMDKSVLRRWAATDTSETLAPVHHTITRHISKDSNVNQECTNPMRQKAPVTEFCVAVPSICGSSVQPLLRVTRLEPIILRWLLDLSKICVPLIFIHRRNTLRPHTDNDARI